MFEISKMSGICQGPDIGGADMPYQPSEESIMTSSYDFRRFMRANEKKGLLDIISYADQEATAAWRSAYHLKTTGKSGESAGQYACILEELVAFLRAAVVCRPAHVTEEVFDQFLQLRRDIAS